MQLFLWIIAITLSFGAAFWVYRADLRRAVPYPWLTALLRGLVLLCTFLLLLAPAISINKNETEKPVIVFLQDNSSSIPLSLKGDTTAYKQQAQQLIEKLSRQYKVIQWGFGNTIQRDTLFTYAQQATDIAQALSVAADFYGAQNLGAVILATDGRFNQGVNPQFTDIPMKGSMYAIALGDSLVQKDIRIAAIYANKTVALHSQFEIRADILAQMCNGYNNNISIREAGAGEAASIPVNIATDRYDKTVSFTMVANRAGMHHYIIEVPSADGEQNTVNNRKDVFIEIVEEQKNILIAAAAPHPDVNAIHEALNGLEGYKVTVRTADNLPPDFSDYQVIILHDLPSSANLLRQLSGLKKPVWYIVGGGSNNNALNQLQQTVKLNVNPFNLQNIFATYNGAFNMFTLPPNINAVMDKMPPLAMPAGTAQAGPAATVLLSAKGNASLPLWTLQQAGTSAAVLLGEGLWRWRLFEYRYFNTHNTIDELIRQTVSFLAVNVNEHPFRVSLPKYIWSDQEPVTMNAYLLNANNDQVNTPDVTIFITDSAGSKQSYTFERSGNAYKLNIGLRAPGTYRYQAATNDNGKTYSAAGSFIVQHLPLEMMETGADYPLLHALANKYNGRLVSYKQTASIYDSILNNENLKPVIQTHTETIPLVEWKWYFILLLLFAAAEWLLRKYWMAQ